MAKGKKHTPEQIVSLLRQIEVAVANGKTIPIACREGGITEQTYYRWRKEFGGLQVDPARRLKELEQENAKLKRLVIGARRRTEKIETHGPFHDADPPYWVKAVRRLPSP